MKPRVIASALLALVLFIAGCGYTPTYIPAPTSTFNPATLIPIFPPINVHSLTPIPSEFITPFTFKLFVGSVNSDVYHRPTCRYAKQINADNEIWFSSSADAKAKGYRPCEICKPP